jgi:hypothetical protein
LSEALDRPLPFWAEACPFLGLTITSLLFFPLYAYKQSSSITAFLSFDKTQTAVEFKPAILSDSHVGLFRRNTNRRKTGGVLPTAGSTPTTVKRQIPTGAAGP